MTATVTPIKPKTALDLDILTALDFEPSPPCEHSQHHKTHVADQFASYRIHVVCPQCTSQAIYLICESGRRRLLTLLTGCLARECGYAAKGSNFVVACTPLENIT